MKDPQPSVFEPVSTEPPTHLMRFLDKAGYSAYVTVTRDDGGEVDEDAVARLFARYDARSRRRDRLIGTLVDIFLPSGDLTHHVGAHDVEKATSALRESGAGVDAVRRRVAFELKRLGLPRDAFRIKAKRGGRLEIVHDEVSRAISWGDAGILVNTLASAATGMTAERLWRLFPGAKAPKPRAPGNRARRARG
jgi:hypothetical protein